MTSRTRSAARNPQDAVSFDVSRRDAALIKRIVSRAIKEGFGGDRTELEMDITATHANGCPLRLRELLEADAFNFNHDVYGIHRRIDRNNGQLTSFFQPRFAVPEGGRP
jgi:hypothetical protein